MRWREPQQLQIQRQWCGGGLKRCHHVDVASRFWELLRGHQDFVTAQLEVLTAEHQTLLCRIPLVQDVQAAWLLLVHCAAARANHVARVVEPGSAEPFCRSHDARLWQCLCTILQISPDQGEDVVGAASMPLVLGGLGLRSACRVSQPAYWASWADALHVIHNRHLEVAAQLVTALDGEPESRFLCAAERELGGMWRV